MARQRTELSPPVRVQRYRAHLVIYLTEDGGGVLIVRVRHGREDWQEDI
ncbi:MAG: type II toxin-antitoxin system RelE/ParE family toxin [Allorhizobium sp.]